jgi:adenylate cyclase
MASSPPPFGAILVGMGLATPSQIEEALALQKTNGMRIGEALVSLGYVNRDELKRALLEGFGLADRKERPRLGEILVTLKYITEVQLDEAVSRQGVDQRPLGDVLVDLGYCTHKAIYEALALQQKRPARQGAPPPGSGLAEGVIKVLLVDDSPIACSFISEGLNGLGFQVHAFEDPFKALAQVETLAPTIVLSDWEMPGMTGEELCRRLKENATRALPVVILTGNEEDAQRVVGLKAGADDYVNKTVSMEELAARLESVVRRTSETERVRKLFARYTSDAVVDEVMRAGGSALRGEKREVTILFADLRNFTGLSEGLPPEQVVGILNEVLGRLADAVLSHEGTLDKFLGDGLIALFGAPTARDDDARRAVETAQMMVASLEALKEEAAVDFREGRRERPLPPLAIGIGVNSGEVVAGNLGSHLRTEYTVIGDAVNVASRLCGIAGPGEVLVGERTFELAKNSMRFQALPPVQLKGKAQLVALYRLLGA